MRASNSKQASDKYQEFLAVLSYALYENRPARNAVTPSPRPSPKREREKNTNTFKVKGQSDDFRLERAMDSIWGAFSLQRGNRTTYGTTNRYSKNAPRSLKSKGCYHRWGPYNPASGSTPRATCTRSGCRFDSAMQSAIRGG